MPARKPSQLLTSVLLADDHGVTRFGLLQFLRSKLDVRTICEAQRFGDAIEILEQQKFDLGIFDLGIPGLKSPRELAQVRERWPQMRVVVLSGSDLRSNILAALEAGVHGYIVKTETMDDLAERLGYVMSGEIYVPPCLAERTGGAVGDAMRIEGDQERNGVAGPRLTQRQQQVLKAMVQGASNKQIAKELKLSVGTVKMHVSAVLTVLGAQNRLHAASLGRKLVD